MTKITTSEARGEAATIILHVLLEQLSPAALAALYRRAKDEAHDIGLPVIEEEVAWICRDAPEATADMLARDGC